MSDKVRKLKENASRLIAKGKLVEATAEYEKVVKLEPRDLLGRQKLAELYARVGRGKDAVHAYQSVAGSYAADGLLLKAIAVCKIILQVDPSHTETQTILADLYAQKRGDQSTVMELPKSMSAALGGPRKKASDIRGTPAHEATQSALRLDPQSDRQSDRHDDRAIDLPPAEPAEMQVDESQIEGEELAAGAATTTSALPTAVSSDIAQLMDAFEQQRQAQSNAMVLPPPAPDAALDPSGDFSIDVDVEPPLVMGTVSAAGPLADSVDDAGLDAASLVRPEPDYAHVTADSALPADEELFLDEGGGDDGGAGEVIELEPARVNVDEMPPIPLFSDLPREAFIALTERMELRLVGAGEDLVAEGDAGASMFIIIQGRMRVRRSVDDNGSAVDMVLAELSDGAFFGEMALLSDAPRTATVTAVDDAMLFEISKELIADITAQYPQVGEVMKRFHKNRLLTNLLKTSPIFQPFSTSDKKLLIEKFKSRHVAEGVYLITRERPGDGLYVLLSGRCEVTDVDEQGRDVALAELKDGDVFGEMSMLWNQETCASVRTVSPCIVLRLPRASFQELIMTHPQILETLTSLSERRAQQNAAITGNVMAAPA